MRTALAVVIALIINGTASGGQPPETGPAGGFVKTDRPMLVAEVTNPSEPANAQRADVPRATGTGLAGVPVGGPHTGLSPGMATLLGIVVVGGIAAIISNQNNNDVPTPAGSGSGGG